MLALCIPSRSFLCTLYSKVSDSLMFAMRILFCSCLCKVRSRVSDALSQALCNLSLAFLADFTLSDSTALIRFIAFSRKLHSAFCLDRKTWSQPSHVFRLTGAAALHCGRIFVGAYCQWPIIELAKNVSPKNKMAATHVVQIHTHARFPRGVKNGRLSRSRTNRKRSSFATKHFQGKSLKFFDLHPPLRLVSFVARIITWCWVTDTQRDTQTKYCNVRCTCARRELIRLSCAQTPPLTWRKRGLQYDIPPDPWGA